MRKQKRGIGFENPKPVTSLFTYGLASTLSAPCSCELADQCWFIDYPPLEKSAWEQKQMEEGSGSFGCALHKQAVPICFSVRCVFMHYV